MQNPNLNGYTGIEAYLPSRQMSVAIVTTARPRAASSESAFATLLFNRLTQYLSPRPPGPFPIGAIDPMTDSEPTTDGAFGRIYEHAELLATILLAIAAVATAWSSYQSARWSGVQAIDFSNANAARVESTRAATQAGQETQVDVLTFTQWVNAYAAKETKLADFYFDRFRKEFKPAVQAWIATDPLKNPKAPPMPFAMPQYKLASKAESEQLLDEAEAATRRSAPVEPALGQLRARGRPLRRRRSSSPGSAPSSRCPASASRCSALGYLLFIGTAIWVATFPVTISVWRPAPGGGAPRPGPGRSAYGLKARKRKAARTHQVDAALLQGGAPRQQGQRADHRGERRAATIWVEPRPSTSGPSSQIEAIAIAGMVSPMLAIAEPKPRLRLIWTRPRRALRAAAKVSGASTSRAITTPTADCGAPIDLTPSSIAPELTLARPTTATRATSSTPKLRSAARAASAAARAPAAVASSPAGRKWLRWRPVWTTRKSRRGRARRPPRRRAASRRIGAGPLLGEGRQDEAEGRQGDHGGEGGRRALGVEAGEPFAQRADSRIEMPTTPLQVIITAAKTVSRASVSVLSPPPTIRVTISPTSITVTATASTSEPNGSPTRCGDHLGVVDGGDHRAAEDVDEDDDRHRRVGPPGGGQRQAAPGPAPRPATCRPAA